MGIGLRWVTDPEMIQQFCQSWIKSRPSRISGPRCRLNVDRNRDKSIANPRLVGRVTPCAPRLKPAGTGFSQTLLANPVAQMMFPESSRPNSCFRVECFFPRLVAIVPVSPARSPAERELRPKPVTPGHTKSK
jgi:hypothetical protein